MPNRSQRRSGTTGEVALRMQKMAEGYEDRIGRQVQAINRLQNALAETRQELMNYQTTVILLIRAAGGELRISEKLIEEAQGYDTVLVRDDPETHEQVFTVGKSEEIEREDDRDVPQ